MNRVNVCISREVRGFPMDHTRSAIGLAFRSSWTRRVGPLASLAAVVLALGSATAIALVPATPAAATTGVNVFVGYADNSRPLIATFPNPWEGSPNATFDGCTTACAAAGFDAGAVRVENDTTSAVIVNQLQVHIDTCLYTWSGPLYPLTLAPGRSLIATQRSTGVAGCTGPVPSSFDSSDIGPGGVAYSGCTNDGIHPTVDVTVDGTTTSYTDSGQIINTGGVDRASCPSGNNESTQWVPVGSAPCSGQNLSLAPPSQTHSVATTATVAATYTNSGGPTCGKPLSGAVVDFKVTSGPNAGMTGTGVTDVNGMASFSYSSLKPGTDAVQASITNTTGSKVASNSVTVTWTIDFAPGGGAFVIGDKNAAVGGSVMFWGAQWAKVNSLTGGPAPRSFKGFAKSPSTPSCGVAWRAAPGNSSPPPDGPLPALMGVIVTSSAAKSGPTTSGDTVQIVLVRTHPGYASNPGHARTGTVVAVLCSTGLSSQGAPPSTDASTAAAPPRSVHAPQHGRAVGLVPAAAIVPNPSHSRRAHPTGIGRLRHQLNA
jgi:hypothetical protein